jgi:hypothetical protein
MIVSGFYDVMAAQHNMPLLSSVAALRNYMTPLALNATSFSTIELNEIARLKLELAAKEKENAELKAKNERLMAENKYFRDNFQIQMQMQITPYDFSKDKEFQMPVIPGIGGQPARGQQL